jgi:hypothetical protein
LFYLEGVGVINTFTGLYDIAKVLIRTEYKDMDLPLRPRKGIIGGGALLNTTNFLRVEQLSASQEAYFQ